MIGAVAASSWLHSVLRISPALLGIRGIQLHDRPTGARSRSLPDGLSPAEGENPDVRRRDNIQRARRSGVMRVPAISYRGAWTGRPWSSWRADARQGWASTRWPSRVGRIRRLSQGEFGANGYVDSQATDAANELAKMGGAKRIVLATVANGAAMDSAHRWTGSRREAPGGGQPRLRWLSLPMH